MIRCDFRLRDCLQRAIIRNVQANDRPGTGRGIPSFYLWGSLAALALRFFLVFKFPAVVDDSRLYADIAKNWMQYGVYGITNSGHVMPTLSRLPGYPAFLAAIFTIFGKDNFRAVLIVQILFDLGTCFMIADMARRLFSERGGKAAFLLAGLCPFLANYSATALTETLEIFFTALALDLALRGLKSNDPSIACWVGCGLAISGGILLRPDGGILLASIGAYLFWLLIRNWRARNSDLSPERIITAGLLIAVCALAPLIPWAIRNFHTFHRFQPLAPRYANDSDEPPMLGFNRWVKTWIAEYVSVEEIYWNVPGVDIDISRLPNRAFDSPQQRQTTAQLFADYNRDHDVTPEMDAQFGDLAAQRIHDSPFRYYVWLPGMRIADMWLRPRTDTFPSDPRWWEFNDDRRWLALSLSLGAINLFYVVLSLAGLIRSRGILGIGLFMSFLLLRSLFLGSIENPEPRYTLECYPAVIILAASVFSKVNKFPTT